jgi:hypothetical protein
LVGWNRIGDDHRRDFVRGSQRSSEIRYIGIIFAKSPVPAAMAPDSDSIGKRRVCCKSEHQMNRQIVIRGAAIAFAGVAASIFAAQQFLDLGASNPQAMGSPNGTSPVVGASLMGSSAPTPAPQTAAPMLDLSANSATESDTAAPQIAALDNGLSPDQALAPSDFQPPLTLAQAAPSANDASCIPTLTANPAIDALVDLRLTAPCQPNARIVVSHDDLAFSTYTDAEGELAIYVPALSQTAMFEVFMPDQSVMTAQAVVPEAAQHVRMVVQWTGTEVVSLHAYHRGANYGETGHIHASRPFDPAADAAFILALGTPRGPEPMLAHVYSLPVEMTPVARAELEFSVNSQTCGRDLSAFVTLKGPGQSGALEELTVTMPDCASSGGTTVVPLPFGQAGLAPVNATLTQTTGQN